MALFDKILHLEFSQFTRIGPLNFLLFQICQRIVYFHLLGTSHVVNIIRTLKERDMIPVIIFSFSRKECEAYATQMTNLDFNTGKFFLISSKRF